MTTHLIRVRLQWEQVKNLYHQHKLNWPAPAQTDNCATIAIDWDNSQWVARDNWTKLRPFLHQHVLSGAIDTSIARGAQVPLLGPGQDPVLLLANFDMSGSAPAMEGNAFWGRDPEGHNRAAQRTYWWRIRDVSIMSPYDRMAEMIQIACTDPKMRSELKQQLGAFANPEILLPMAGIFLVFFGAEALGGAAFVFAVKAILGIGQFATDVSQYEGHFIQLNKIMTEERRNESDLYYGAQLIQELLIRLMQDIAMALGVHAIASVVKRLVRAFIEYSPETWKQKAKEYRAKAEHVASRVKASRYGYKGEEFLKPIGTVNFTASELEAHAEVSRDRFRAIVLREGKENRMPLARSQVWYEGKSQWMKGTKSYKGFHGLMCFEKGAWCEGHPPVKPAGTYDMGHLLGISKELDDYIRLPGGGTRKCRMYELPTDGRAIPEVDYGRGPGEAAEHGANGPHKSEMQGHYLVDLGTHEGVQKLMVVNKTKGPYGGDNDIGAIYDPHGPSKGQFKDPGSKVANPEDSLELEYDINRRIWDKDSTTTGRMTSSAQHGGNYGSMGHAVIQGERQQKHWKPVNKGVWEQERLVIMLPVKNALGRPSSHMFVVENWQQLQRFWEANNWQWPESWH